MISVLRQRPEDLRRQPEQHCESQGGWGYTVKPRGQTQTNQNRKGVTQVKFGGGVSDLETWVAGKEKAIKSSGLS